MTARIPLAAILATIAAAVAWAQCPPDQVILNGASLGPGIDVGVDTSGGRRDWIAFADGNLIMQYPSGQAWGTVYFTFGAAAPEGSRTGRDMSACQNLVLEMMGDPGTVSVGIKDSTQHDNGLEPTVPVQISGQWQTYTLPLSRFSPTNLKSLYIAAELNFTGPQAQLLRARSIRLTSGSATKRVLPQFVFGGGWYSAVYFANASDQPASVDVQFIGDDGKPMAVPAVGSSSTTLNLAARGTAILEAPNSGPLTQGYAVATMPDSVIGYGVFRQSVGDRADQEAVVPLSGSSSTSSTLIWDETGFVTGVAIVNPSNVSTTVAVLARDSAGQMIGTSSITLGSGAKTALALRNLPGLSAVAGTRGSAAFTVNSGAVAVLGLRFGGQAFTSIPASEK